MSAQRRLWSDWADAQTDLSLRWAHTHFAGFVTRRLKYIPQTHQFVQEIECRNDITTLASYDRHGSDSILSPQCNSWKVIHFSLIIWVYKVCFWIFCNNFLSDHLSISLDHFALDSTLYSSIKSIIFVIFQTNKQNGRHCLHIKKSDKTWFNKVILWKRGTFV